MTVYTAVSGDEMVRGVAALATRIAADAAWAPDCLVGIGRGGLVPAVYLSHAMGVPMASLDFSAAPAEIAGDALARLAGRAAAGERLLFVDDINDTGRTIARIRSALAAGGAPAGDVRFAVLIDNLRSGERVDHAARTIDRTVARDWFVFPWEAMAPAAAVAADAAEVPERTA